MLKWIGSQLGARNDREAEEILNEMSAASLKLIRRAMKGIDFTQLVDHHCHVLGKPTVIAGLGRGGTGCEVNPTYFSTLNPVRRIKTWT